MYRCFPSTISDTWLLNSLHDQKIPNMYPDFQFLNEHYKILEKYQDAIKYYKSDGYMRINAFLRTGFGDKETLKMIKKLIELYKIVKPLPYDIVIYRGTTYTIGQDFLTGSCVKAKKYKKPRKFEDKICPNMIPIKLTKNYKEKDNIRDYIYENLSFVSTTTGIFTAINFSRNNTIMAFVLKAGTKFICPLSKRGQDFENELILFPMHNSFILTDTVNIKIINKEHEVHVGIVSNKLNKYRLPNHPILQERIETNIEEVENCIIENQKDRYKCTKTKIAECAKKGTYCTEGKCSSYILTDCNDIDKFFWYINNEIVVKELQQLKPYGSCSKRRLLYANKNGWSEYICDPKDGKITSLYDKNALKRLQKEVDRQKATGIIIDFDYPNMTLETLKFQTRVRGLKDKKSHEALVSQLLLNDRIYEIEAIFLPVPTYSKQNEYTKSYINQQLNHLYKEYKSSKEKELKILYKNIFDKYLEQNAWFKKTKEYEKIVILKF